MTPLQVEFRRTAVAGRWHWALAMLVAAVTLGAICDAGWACWRLRQAQDQLARMAAASALASPPPKAAAKQPPAYARSAREMLAAAQTPWPDALIALEAVSIPGVRVTSVEISVAERVARVEVEVQSYAVLLKYLEELNAGEATSSWVLLSAESQPGAGGVPTGPLTGRIKRAL